MVSALPLSNQVTSGSTGRSLASSDTHSVMTTNPQDLKNITQSSSLERKMDRADPRLQHPLPAVQGPEEERQILSEKKITSPNPDSLNGLKPEAYIRSCVELRRSEDLEVGPVEEQWFNSRDKGPRNSAHPI